MGYVQQLMIEKLIDNVLERRAKASRDNMFLFFVFGCVMIAFGFNLHRVVVGH